MEPQEEGRNNLAIRLLYDLQRYGLTEGQAKLYLYLVGKPPMFARMISKELNFHRVDAYRKLRELEDQGLVEEHLGSPKRFSAVNPHIALSSLLYRIESNVSNMKQIAHEVEQKLKQYKKDSELLYQNDSSNLVGTREMYRFVVGRERYYKETHTMLRNARKEILRIISANGIKRTFTCGFYRDYVRANSEGVKIRMISEINDENRSQAKKLSKLFELRHLKNVHLRFGVVDNQFTTLSVRMDDSNLSNRTGGDSYLFSNDPRFAETTAFLFEHLWDTSEKIHL